MQRIEKNIPYTLSTDYNELFDRLESGEVIVGFYDKVFSGSDYIHRDVCQLEMKDGVITGGVRGVGCLNLTEFDIELYNKESNLPPVTLKELFTKDCKGINLGWIQPE